MSNIYSIKYLQDNDLKIAYVKANGVSDAKKNFSSKFPDVNTEDILDTKYLDDNKKDYQLTILVAKIIAFLGWATIAIAGITLLITIFNMFSHGRGMGLEFIFIILPSLGAIAVGLVLIIIGQSSRAILDNTNYTREMLEIMLSSR